MGGILSFGASLQRDCGWGAKKLVGACMHGDSSEFVVCGCCAETLATFKLRERKLILCSQVDGPDSGGGCFLVA